MNLNPLKFGLAAGITAGLLYAICAVVSLLWPDGAVKLLGWMFHLIRVESFAGNGNLEVTLPGAVMGLLQTFVYTFAAFYVFGWLYNKLTKTAPK
ncbi:MAG: hypothetical protein HYV77_01810 [Candidatus Wildermuthbacteria bacterium]|nr:hypothetical protein [Candidatus Wildermuthbacteria bacterium]